MSDLRWRRYRRRVFLGGATAVALTAAFGQTRLTAITSSERSTVGTAATPVPTATSRPKVALFGLPLHAVDMTFDPDAYARMASMYQSTGTKEFVEGDLIIDGSTVASVGVRLKGNSTLGSLRRGATSGNNRGGIGPLGAALSFDRPEQLPWLVSFDEFVPGQRYQGYEQIALRPASGAGLAEALALKLVGVAGEPTQRSMYTAFTVNEGSTLMRLVVEVPDSKYAEDNFKGEGVLYKARSSGTFRYLGDDPLSYASAFKQITNKNKQDLRPLIELLRWVTQSSEAEFAARLAEHVDVESLARYVAIQDLLSNFDDMSGPGQNYYLWYDLETSRFRVLSWDMNLAFGGLGRGAGAVAPPGGGVAPRGGGVAPAGGSGRGANPLKTRFVAASAFATVRDSARTEVARSIYRSGAAAKELEALRTLLASTGLIAAATLDGEAASLKSKIESLAAS